MWVQIGGVIDEVFMPHPASDERFPILNDETRYRVAQRLAGIALQASQLVDDFAAVERIPRYADGHRENDV